MKKITNVKETELTDEQLDAVSGGTTSLWDIFGPVITEVVNAPLQSSFPPIITYPPGKCPGQNS